MGPDDDIGGTIRPSQQDDATLRHRTRRGFLTAALATAAGYGGWRWLRSRPAVEEAAWPLRDALKANERVERAYFSGGHRAAVLPAGSAPTDPRVNGDIGLDGTVDPDHWRLHVAGLAAGDGTAALTLADVKALPLVRLTMTHYCVEGWSIQVNWGGCRFADFARRYPPATRTGQPLDLDQRPGDIPDYVAMATPDGSYFVGLDAAAAVHPQTLLCYEIDSQPITPAHGAPLRLVIPTKYGIKNIKRIGSIHYTPDRPQDYWAQQGYDWYAGL